MYGTSQITVHYCFVVWCNSFSVFFSWPFSVVAYVQSMTSKMRSDYQILDAARFQVNNLVLAVCLYVQDRLTPATLCCCDYLNILYEMQLEIEYWLVNCCTVIVSLFVNCLLTTIMQVNCDCDSVMKQVPLSSSSTETCEEIGHVSKENYLSDFYWICC